MSFKIIPYPGPPNEYFIGVDPYGYDGLVATCCVMKRTIYPDLEIVASFQGRNNESFKRQVQDYVDKLKIHYNSIAIFEQ